MGTLIRVIFREGVPRQRNGNRMIAGRRSSLARERGLTLWREREDLVIAAAYRVAPPAESREADCSGPPLKFARLAPQG